MIIPRREFIVAAAAVPSEELFKDAQGRPVSLVENDRALRELFG